MGPFYCSRLLLMSDWEFIFGAYIYVSWDWPKNLINERGRDIGPVKRAYSLSVH